MCASFDSASVQLQQGCLATAAVLDLWTHYIKMPTVNAYGTEEKPACIYWLGIASCQAEGQHTTTTACPGDELVNVW